MERKLEIDSASARETASKILAKAKKTLDKASQDASREDAKARKAKRLLDSTVAKGKARLDDTVQACGHFEALLLSKEESVQRLNAQVRSACDTLKQLSTETQELKRIATRESLARQSRLHTAESKKRVLALRRAQLKARVDETLAMLRERENELAHLESLVRDPAAEAAAAVYRRQDGGDVDVQVLGEATRSMREQ